MQLTVLCAYISIIFLDLHAFLTHLLVLILVYCLFLFMLNVRYLMILIIHIDCPDWICSFPRLHLSRAPPFFVNIWLFVNFMIFNTSSLLLHLKYFVWTWSKYRCKMQFDMFDFKNVRGCMSFPSITSSCTHG